MYAGDGGDLDKEEQLRVLHEERKAIVDKYDLGREEGAVIDDWEDPKLEIYHRKDRFGFIKDSRLPDDAYRTEKQLKQLEKEMSRLKKWLKMEEQKSHWFPVGSRHHDKMVDRVWKGVPERLRGKLWAILLDLDRIKLEQVGKYQEMKELARKYSPDIRQIDLDVNRTYRDHEMFRERYNSRQQDLFHVLAAYSMFNTEVGYCQGMSQIAALLLMYLNSEEDAFWALSQLMSAPKYNMHGFFIHGFPKLLRFQDHHDKILHKKLRRLQKHLSAQNITTGLYTLKWFFQCFLDRLPFSISVRVWDLYLLEGETIMFATAFTILRLHRKTLLRLQMDELIEFLQKTLAEDFYFEDDFVIETALRENLQELRSGRLHSAGPPPDSELPQKPFGLVDISQQEKNIVLGSQLRTPVGDEEKELHRNSMRRELDSALKLSNLTDTSLGNNESCESLETPVLDRRQVNHTSHEPGETDQNTEPRDSLVQLMSSAVIGQTEPERVRPASLTNERPGSSLGDKRKSAAADLSQFRLETAPASFPTDVSHTRSSSLLQDSTRSSSVLHESHTRSSSVLQESTSKSASVQQPGRRSQSRTSRVSSRTSSRLDTTGSSGVLNSSYEEHHQSRASYYFGEAPDLRDILANVNGNGSVEAVWDNGGAGRGVISPHTGEVVRIKVPFTAGAEDSQVGQCLSAENIQRLADQQISPSYNGHRVTIKVNRSNEAISNNHSAQVSPSNALTPMKSRLRTSSVQHIPSNKLRDNGEFLDFSRETFF